MHTDESSSGEYSIFFPTHCELKFFQPDRIGPFLQIVQVGV
jgi:hypothetical protein